jgi:retron-type reverse transcriptase
LFANERVLSKIGDWCVGFYRGVILWIDIAKRMETVEHNYLRYYVTCNITPPYRYKLLLILQKIQFSIVISRQIGVIFGEAKDFYE